MWYYYDMPTIYERRYNHCLKKYVGFGDLYCSRTCFYSSSDARKKKSLSKLGAKNPMWKGDDVGYYALHEWMKTRFVKPDLCHMCKYKKPMDLANISGQYKRDLSDWEYLCRSCHMVKDGRMDKLHSIPRPRGADNPRWKGGPSECSVCNITLTDRTAKNCMRHRKVHRGYKLKNYTRPLKLKLDIEEINRLHKQGFTINKIAKIKKTCWGTIKKRIKV